MGAVDGFREEQGDKGESVIKVKVRIVKSGEWRLQSRVGGKGERGSGDGMRTGWRNRGEWHDGEGAGRSVQRAGRTQGREIQDGWATGRWPVRRGKLVRIVGRWERGRGAVVAVLGSGGGGSRRRRR